MPPSIDHEPCLDLLDAHRAPFDPEQRSLGFGLFDHAFERQYCPGAPHYDVADPLLNEAAEERHFVGSDSRRFYLRVRQPEQEPVGRLPNQAGFVVARWYTRDRRGGVLDDNGGASEITLVETEPGVFVSPGLTLVTWEQDQALAPHCGIDGRYPAGHELRPYGASDHRIRLGSMFGDVVVEYPATIHAEARLQRVLAHPFVPADRRCLPLHLFVGSRSGTRRPVASPQELRAGLDRLRRVYQSIGVAAQTVPHTVAELLVVRQDPSVAKLALNEGGVDFCYVIDVRALLGYGVDSESFDARAFAAFGRRFPDFGTTARVLYVDAFDDGKFGMACPPFDCAGRPESGACACQAERYPDRALTAHEVGHILTNKGIAWGTIADQTNGFRQYGGHFSRPAEPPDNRYLHFYNLMGGSRFRLYDVNVTEKSTDASEIRTFNQYADIRSSPYLKRLPTPG